MEAKERARKLNVIYADMHGDFKGKLNGVRTVMVYRQGTQLIALDSMTDAEIEDYYGRCAKRVRIV